MRVPPQPDSGSSGWAPTQTTFGLALAGSAAGASPAPAAAMSRSNGVLAAVEALRKVRRLIARFFMGHSGRMRQQLFEFFQARFELGILSFDSPKPDVSVLIFGLEFLIQALNRRQCHAIRIHHADVFVVHPHG